ncbi:CHAT domain-containing protein [Bizionia arctica]|uniref:CHAT domain-containing protein n=1 Tax=Bizionia arctica TaxID=1495645 RepID=UPI001668CE0B|nr:CHAT domain-containing protein [Bizionia arctica]
MSDKLIASHELNTQMDSLYYLGYLAFNGLGYLELEQLNKAEKQLEFTLQKAQDFTQIHRVVVIQPTSNLALLYYKKGEFEKAEKLFLEALTIQEEEYGKNNLGYTAILGNLAEIYFDIGELGQAEKSYLEIIGIHKLLSNDNGYEYGLALNNLGSFYLNIGQYQKAYDSFVEAFPLIPTEHPNYLLLLNNYAMCLDNLGNKVEAEKCYVHVIKKCEEVGDFSEIYTTALNNLGQLYFEEKHYEEALPILLAALKVKKNIYGASSLNYAITLGNLGLLYIETNQIEKAEITYLKTLTILEDNNQLDGKYYKSTVNNLALLYIEMKQYEKASFYLQNSALVDHENYLEVLTFLSQDELALFKKINLNPHYSTLSFMRDYPLSDSLKLSSYQNEILIKNLSLRNQQRIKNNILKTKDTVLINSYSQFIKQKKQLAQWEKLPLSDRSQVYEQLDIDTEKLEKYLSRNSSEFETSENVLSINFNQVQEKLKSNELIIDLVAFNYYDKKWTDSIKYSAFIIGKNYNSPKYIPLFEQQQLDSLLNQTNVHEASINKLYTGQAISDLFIAPLSKELERITTIYIVPSGLGHQIDFAALPFSGNKTLGEAFKVHLLGSSSSLINYESTVFKLQKDLELLLYGDIDYDKQSAISAEENDIVNSEVADDFMELVSRSGINTWGYLAGTEKEVSIIKKQSDANGYATRIINGTQATKSSILQLDGKTTPYVLHLATHGYFFENPKILEDNNLETTKSSYYKASEDPMLRSGLIFAGVNTYWGEPIESSVIDDGVLTAKEISNLDLSSCQLVVLSACETGLGDINGSEGVFGLQRAFKMAGVKNIIMSLWKVPDEQTAELFELFYGYCFQGESIHEALRMAQAEMKLKYSPYYWAGFVLLE